MDDLIKKAIELRSMGLSEGQISEELNISSETVTWILTRGERAAVPGPKDISVDWSMIGRSAYRLSHIAQAISEMIFDVLDERELDVDMVVGVALSGVPLASMVANHMGVGLAVYMPTKQIVSQDVKPRGNLSTNFSEVDGKECVIVDDVITSGRTLEEAVAYLDDHGAKTNVIAVLIDKKGVESIAGVPVCSLLKVIRVN